MFGREFGMHARNVFVLDAACLPLFPLLRVVFYLLSAGFFSDTALAAAAVDAC